jgi:hypothetical protein
MIPRRVGQGGGRLLGIRSAVVLALASLAAGTAALAVAARQEPTFPHARHQGLFPLCTGCHQGIPSGDREVFYPSPQLCEGCHNGKDMDPVAWKAPAARVDNLRFVHDVHASYLEDFGDPAQTCQACHVPQGQNRMSVSAQIQVGTCLSCHAHQAQEHQVDAQCSTCHIPLAESGFTRARIEAFTAPADHAEESFLGGGHGKAAGKNLARCATCHTADRCVACHVDTDRPEIARMAFAPAGMDLPPFVARYSKPASHQDEGWLGVHGKQASRAACATCHTTEDCKSCHIAPFPDTVNALPSRDDVVAPGVRVAGHAPASHESFFFLEVHPVHAASAPSSCSTCHLESFCIECHEGPVGGGYHPSGFVARHAADAFGRETECANCHDADVFCRSCHVQSGLTSVGRLGPGYHEGGATWLLRHGQAARQNLESCTTCHRQNDCTQCHGVLGAFKISPHSRGFDAERAWERSPRTCLACHIKNPLEGRTP